MTTDERFDAKWTLDPATGCHVWHGGKSGNGYGAFKANGKMIPAHRFAFVRKAGKFSLLMSETLDHRCMNIVCVNPAHLEPVTRGENSRRQHAAQTHCLRGHPLSGANVYGWGGRRHCRTCRLLWKRAHPTVGPR